MSTGEADLWLIAATFLVLAMQAGFLMLEGGRVRSKNSINVAQKNVTDLIVIWVVFFGAGFYLMFGVSAPDLLSGTQPDSAAKPLHFVYQFAFASTAATIISGAVAERISFKAYLALVAVVGLIIYPVVGRFTWGEAYNPEVQAYLADFGFMDFAGSTVVHALGGTIGLVAVLMIGPRIGRFDMDGNPIVLPAHNAVMALFGVFILMLGWLGFNGGAVSPEDPLLQLIFVNTLSAAIFGGAAGMMIGVSIDKGVFNPSRVTSGLVGGLVAITAGVNVMSVYDAIVVGMLGGAIATAGAEIILHKFSIDDPLDVIATHGLAGIFGTLAVAWVAPLPSLAASSRLEQFGIQLVSITCILCFAALVTWFCIKLLSCFMHVRVSARAEEIGLNYTEHGEAIGMNRLENALREKLDGNASFADGIAVNSNDEHSELASTLNKLIGKYEHASQEIRQAEARFKQFAETASDWLWEADANLRLTYIHSNANNSRQLKLDDIVGHHLVDVLSIEDSALAKLNCCLRSSLQIPVLEAILLPGKNRDYPVPVEVRAVPCLDREGCVTIYRGTLTDISVRKSAEDKALFLSMHDELTKLPNRRALTQNLNVATSKAKLNGRTIVIAGLDLDGFKAVNDAYGHAVGDALLQMVTERLKRFLRRVDFAYRTGGDEFVVVLDAMHSQNAITIAHSVFERLIEELSKPYAIQTLKVRIGASVGLSSYPHDSNIIGDLLRMADLALYAAKESGKGCAMRYKREFDKDAALQRQLEQDLNKAIVNNEFYLMYQPQVDTQTEMIMGYEALIRWRHPERGEISPVEFIDVAEKLNLMDHIGAFVLDTACEFAATWDSKNALQPLRISVNVSPQQLKSARFFDLVVDTLNRHRLEPSRLELEVTENMLVHDFRAVTVVLQNLRDFGVCIAVDDFGTGQTSLRYLNMFPLSTIKIDRSFIKHISENGSAAEITRTIVQLGQQLGVKVIAEGVEDLSQLTKLKRWNCDQVQGFLFSKPISCDEVNRCLEELATRYKKAS